MNTDIQKGSLPVTLVSPSIIMWAPYPCYRTMKCKIFCDVVAKPKLTFDRSSCLVDLDFGETMKKGKILVLCYGIYGFSQIKPWMKPNIVGEQARNHFENR